MATLPTRRAGRPRSEAARQAILQAALEIARERGTAGLTMDAVARRATVSKETVYRWWRSKGEVLLEALAELGERNIPTRDTGTLAGDLATFMRATARTLDAPTRRVLRTLAAQAAANEAFAGDVRDRFLARRREALATILDRAVERGELAPERSAMLQDVVFGSLWYRLIFGVAPLDRAWADAVTETVCAASSP
jgi:AcrR family transcriptional regulator